MGRHRAQLRPPRGELQAPPVLVAEADFRLAEETLLELGPEAVRLGGCPLSEHGVGNQIPQIPQNSRSRPRP